MATGEPEGQGCFLVTECLGICMLELEPDSKMKSLIWSVIFHLDGKLVPNYRTDSVAHMHTSLLWDVSSRLGRGKA